MTIKTDAKISASILSADFGNLEAELAQLDPELVDFIHVDVMDGRFVPNLTIGPIVVKAVKKLTTIPLDVHLMIEEPERYIDDFIDAGASILTVHAEASTHLQRSLSHIRARGAKAGVSLNPATSLSCIENILPDVDLILLMTVNPGFAGQKFIPQMKDKILRCRDLISNYSIDLEVDGGIKQSNIKELYDCGARVFVSGSEIFGNPPYNEKVRQMKSALCLS